MGRHRVMYYNRIYRRKSKIITMKKLSLLLGLLSFMMLFGVARATTYECDSCSDCSDKLQNVAAYGDIVLLNTSIYGYSSSDCIDFYGEEPASNGITFDCGWKTIDADGVNGNIGIHAPTMTYTTIRNCVITDFNAYAILADDSPAHLTVSNIIANNNDIGIKIEATGIQNLYAAVSNVTISNSATGIFLAGSSPRYVTISYSNISYNSNGFLTGDSGARYVTISYSSISYNNYGLNIYGDNRYYTIEYNRFVEGGVAILTEAAGDSYNNIIRNNNFTRCDKAISTGGKDTNITNNYIDSCDYGLEMIGEMNNTLISGNTIKNSTYNGFDNNGMSDVNLYTRFFNNFLNNSVNFQDDGGTGQWGYFNTTKTNATNIIGGAQTGGNYWAAPNGAGYSQTCANSNNDSFCDNAYVLSSYEEVLNNTDFLPLTSNYSSPSLTPPDISWNSPANNSVTQNQSWIFWNATISETGGSAILNINGTANYTMSWSGNYSYYNFTGSNTTTYCGKIYANDSSGNMNLSSTRCATINLTSYSDTTPPTITITLPQNISYAETSIMLNASANEAINTWWYSLNGGTNTTFTPNTTITASQGSNNIIVYANDTFGNIGSSRVSFFVDSVAPTITITSPQNITYNGVSQANLNVSASESVSSWWYSINGGSNTTFTPNITINIANGSNILFVYANDTLGNTGKASVSFTGNYPTVTYLNSPDDGNETISSVPINITFNCSAINDVNLVNITFYLNGVPNETKSVTGIYNFSIFTKTLPIGDYNWTCRACDYADQCSFGVPSRTFSIITTPTPSYRLSSVLPYPWGYIAGIVLGAGLILFILATLLGGEIADLLNPKNLALIFIGLLVVAVFIAGIV